MDSSIAIDIVILPPPNIMDELIGLIKYTESSPIVLNKTNCLPHISLAMGIVNENDLDKLAASIAETIASANAFEIVISHTEQVKIEKGQVFGSAIVDSNAALTKLQLDISKKLLALMSPESLSKDMFVSPPEIPDINIIWAEKFGDANLQETYSPHVTLGEGTLSQLPKPITFTAKQIAVCQLGNYFTCRKVLYKFETKD